MAVYSLHTLQVRQRGRGKSAFEHYAAGKVLTYLLLLYLAAPGHCTGHAIVWTRVTHPGACLPTGADATGQIELFFCVEPSRAIYDYLMHIVVYKQEKEVVAIPITDNGLR